MKYIQKNRNTNMQEDEDGFSLNPYDIFINKSTNRHPDPGTIRNITISESDTAKLTMISSEEKRYTNNVTHFPDQVTIIYKKKLIAT